MGPIVGEGDAEAAAKDWLSGLADAGASEGTITSYGSGLARWFAFCMDRGIDPLAAEVSDVDAYVAVLSEPRTFPGRNWKEKPLAVATQRHRLTVLRRWYDFLTEMNLCQRHPVLGSFARHAERVSEDKRCRLPRKSRELPWIPTDEQWQRLVKVVARDGPRSRLMLALHYDTAVSVPELCALDHHDVDISKGVLRVRSTPGSRLTPRVLPFSATTATVHTQYLAARGGPVVADGPLFLSESRRNHGHAITASTWRGAAARLGGKAGLPRAFTADTIRHLRLVHLAKAGMDLLDVMTFAGLTHPSSVRIYYELAGFWPR